MARPASAFKAVHGELARFEPRVSRALRRAGDRYVAGVSINALAPALEAAQRQHRAMGRGPDDTVPDHEIDAVMRALPPLAGLQEPIAAAVAPIIDDARARGRKLGRAALPPAGEE